jgi:hypothetical protein
MYYIYNGSLYDSIRKYCVKQLYNKNTTVYEVNVCILRFKQSVKYIWGIKWNLI